MAWAVRAKSPEIVPRPQTGWMALMYVVAAIGAFMAATRPNDDDLILFHCARSHLSINMLEVGNLTLVQSLTLISNYLQKRDRPNSSYNYLGLAIRMALGLGLHKDFPRCKSNLLHEEIRRRTWWCLYIFDAGSTITFGRPLTITSAGIDAKLPLNTFDSNLTASTLSSPGNVESPTIYTSVRVQSQFHLLTTSLYNRIISKPFPSAKQVLLWDDLYIGRWLQLVPEYYREDAIVPERHALSHAIMTWRYKYLRMVIYRPFLIQNALMSSRHGSSPGACSEDNTGNIDSKSDEGSYSSSSVYAEVTCKRCLKESHETIRHVNKFWQTHARMAEQVRIMNDIYTKAWHVVIWLGKETPEDKMAFELLDRFKEIFDERGLVEIGPEHYRAVGLPTIHDSDWSHWTAVVELFQRSWFQRIWVVQEAAVCNRRRVSVNFPSIDIYHN